MKLPLLPVALWFTLTSVGPAAEPSPQEIRDAVSKALPLIQKSAVGHRTQRTCFACHNQGIPILALTTVRSRGFSIDEKELQTQLQYINDFLDKNRANYLQGKGQGGAADTAGYALWTLELAGWKPNATTAAVAEYLLLYKKDQDHWNVTSSRPPSEASSFTTSYLAVRTLQAFGTPEQKERIAQRTKQTREWLAKTPSKDTEDRAFRLWALKRAGADAKEVSAAAEQLLKTQRLDGGWAQTNELDSDAYATGTALVALHEAGGVGTDAAAYQRGVAYLLRSQLADGSWYIRSRSRPFQTYYESGFPHGTDQFISAAGSSWATTALALALPPAKRQAEDIRKRAEAVLAKLDGELSIPGLKEPVEVLRDRWGVPHIYAKNADDLFFAQGFVAAQDRLFQIDLWRRVAVGETAEITGKSGLEADRFARLLKYRGDMQAEWTSYSPDTKQIATAFTRGINAYIDHVGERLPIEFELLGIKPKKWQPEDILGRMAGIIMTRNFHLEISRAELIAAVGLEKARRLAPVDPVTPFAPAEGLDLKGIDRSVLAGFREATAALRLKSVDDGSNNWVVDGKLSASGKPMLASDPHRAIALPSLRYLVHLNAPGWNVIGSGEPALPGVAIGHNERVAWGFTIVGTDQADLFVEEIDPTDRLRYRVGERWEKMQVISEKVPVKGEAQPVGVELRFTRHGPVIHTDSERNRAFALKWVGSEPGGAAYLGSLALNRAQNAGEFTDSLKAWKSPSENMVFADVDGNIGWLAAGLIPRRQGFDGLLPVPGASDKHSWQGYASLKEHPQVHNPGSHWIATANHNIMPPGSSQPISYDWSLPYRFLRIKERMEAKNKFTLEDFQSIQHDNTSLPGLALARLLKTANLREESLQPYIDTLAGWDGVLSADSQAGALYAMWLKELLEGFFRPHVPARLLEFVTSRGGVPVMLAALEKPDAAWFGEKPLEARDALLRKTLDAAVKKLRERFPDEKGWSWGHLHTTPFRHPLAALGSEHGKAFNLGPVPRAGDGFTPNAASHDALFKQTGGATYRHVFDLADWDRGLATSAPGQSGQLGSPHYTDLLPLWDKGEYFPLAFSRSKVEQVTAHRLRLKPQ